MLSIDIRSPWRKSDIEERREELAQRMRSSTVSFILHISLLVVFLMFMGMILQSWIDVIYFDMEQPGPRDDLLIGRELAIVIASLLLTLLPVFFLKRVFEKSFYARSEIEREFMELEYANGFLKDIQALCPLNFRVKQYVDAVLVEGRELAMVEVTMLKNELFYSGALR